MSLIDKQITVPRILLLCDRPLWAFDFDAKSLVRELSDRFIFEIMYVEQSPVIDENNFDLIWVFWWGERYHQKFISDRTKIVKEISSHRWEVEEFYGKHSAPDAFRRYMLDAEHLTVSSKRLLATFSGIISNLHFYPKGVDTELFQVTRTRTGLLEIGWAGNVSDPTKGLNDILLPACGEEFRLNVAGGELSREEMVDFYNRIDVICVASIAESNPLTLLEAMACGCFPICTDVGVASELIESGKNGLIVERTPDAFRDAFNWCQENLDLIRECAESNRKLIVENRSSGTEANGFAMIVERILHMNERIKESQAPIIAECPIDYSEHYDSINPLGDSISAYHSHKTSFDEDLCELIPKRKDARILEIGPGHGHLLRFLVESGYRRIFCVDLSASLLNGVKRSLGDKLEGMEVADGTEYLKRHNNEFECIIMLDVIEHFEEPKALETLRAARAALTNGGTIILRTPNMANLLGNYSLHMDLTHRRGYTEWSLIQLLKASGFKAAKSHLPRAPKSIKRKLFSFVNGVIHRFMYRINNRVVPSHYGKNIVVTADK